MAGRIKQRKYFFFHHGHNHRLTEIFRVLIIKAQKSSARSQIPTHT